MKKFGIAHILTLISCLCGMVLIFYILNHSLLQLNIKMIFVLIIILVNFCIFFITKLKGKIVRNVVSALTVVVILIQIIGVNYVIGLDMVFEHLSSNTHTNVIVYVKKDSQLTSSDLKDKKIGITSGDDIGYFLNANQYLNGELEIKYSYKQLFEELESGKLDAVMTLEQNYSKVYREYRDLDINMKSIKSFSVDDIYADLRAEDLINKSYTVYVGGNIDDHQRINNSESNINFLVTVNPNSKKILFVLIPNDALFFNSCLELDHLQKISEIGGNGISCSMKTIADTLDIKLNYFLYFNLDSVNDKSLLLDFVLNSQDMKKSNYKKLRKVSMNSIGRFALKTSSIKLTFEEWYHLYDKNGTDVVKDLIENIRLSTLLTNYEKFMKLIRTGIYTSFTSNEIKSLVKRQIEENIEWEVESYSLTGKDTLVYSENHPENVEKALDIHPDSIKEAVSKIKELLEENR